MKILSVDTATQSCGVAIIRDRVVVSEVNVMRRQTHSRHLHEMIHQTVTLSGIPLSRLDGFAVTRGPGSFTGLRIGLSCIKGLAFAMKKPVAGVSSLEVLASQAALFLDCAGRLPEMICSVMDARKKEVYIGRFRHEDGRLTALGHEGVFSPEKITDEINRPCVFVGDGALLYKDIIEKSAKSEPFFVPEPLNRIYARTVAFLAYARLMENDRDDLAGLVPAYIRKSDAELRLGRAARMPI